MVNVRRQPSLALPNRLLTTLVCATAVSCAVSVPDKTNFLADRCQWRIAPGDPSRSMVLTTVMPMTHKGAVDQDTLVRNQAIELAVRQVNAQGGVSGRLFALRVCDRGGQWFGAQDTDAAELGAWLAEHGARAVITGDSADTLAIHDNKRHADVLVMSFMATGVALTALQDDDLVWRVSASDAVRGAVMAHTLAARGATKVGVVYQADSEHASDLSNALVDAATGLQTARFEAKNLETLSATMAAVSATAPDWLAVIGSDSAARAILNIRAATPGLQATKLMLCDNMHSTVALAAVLPSTSVHGALGTLAGEDVGPARADFVAAFTARFGPPIRQLGPMARGYDAAFTLMLAHAFALRADPDRQVTGKDLAAGLKQLNAGAAHIVGPSSWAAATQTLLAGGSINVQGASGELDFDVATGDVASRVEVWQVQPDLSLAPLHWVQATKIGAKWTYQQSPAK